MVILALVAIGSLNKAEPDVKAAKRSSNILMVLAILTGVGNYMAKGKKEL